MTVWSAHFLAEFQGSESGSREISVFGGCTSVKTSSATPRPAFPMRPHPLSSLRDYHSSPTQVAVSLANPHSISIDSSGSVQ